MLINNFLLALLLTIMIESIVAFFLGYRDKRLYITLILANIITNPALNYILALIYYMGMYRLYKPAEIFLEIAAVIIEWRLFVYALDRNSKSMLKLSLAINVSSFLAGLLIFR
ncbi:MAG TPA: hypothetical protein DD426_08285 [Clostridiaceae bacterium]|nr:hypothetical protein [Clostridiaceae bacterium]